MMSRDQTNPTYLNPPEMNFSNESETAMNIHQTAMDMISSIGAQF